MIAPTIKSLNQPSRISLTSKKTMKDSQLESPAKNKPKNIASAGI
jgi:hypothetical protein